MLVRWPDTVTFRLTSLLGILFLRHRFVVERTFPGKLIQTHAAHNYKYNLYG